MNPHGLRKTSSPKFVVPHVSEHESGSASSTVSRVSSGSCTEPPVESWTTRSVASRTASTARAATPVQRRGVVGVADVHVDQRRPGRLAAPSGLDELVEGRRQLGHVRLGVSAPVGATVMRVPTGVDAEARWPWTPRSFRSLPKILRGSATRRRRSAMPPTPRREDRVLRDRALDHRERDRAVLVVPSDRRDPPHLPVAERTGAPASGSTCPDPSRCRKTRRRGGRPRLCTRATVSWPR
jgi:hypothetical protein